MKTNGQMDGSARPCLKADPRYHQAWADYFVKWFQTYAKFGIPFWGLTIQNEPENAGVWESCYYTPEEELAFFLDYLHPTIRKAFPDLNIMFFDHNKDHALVWAKTFFDNPRALDLVWGIAIHWYSGDSFENVRQIHDQWPEKNIMATEACNCGGPATGDAGWARAETYVHDIIGDLNAFAKGWTDWYTAAPGTDTPPHRSSSSCPHVACCSPHAHYHPVQEHSAGSARRAQSCQYCNPSSCLQQG
jgi:glucosylceramidase